MLFEPLKEICCNNAYLSDSAILIISRSSRIEFATKIIANAIPRPCVKRDHVVEAAVRFEPGDVGDPPDIQ